MEQVIEDEITIGNKLIASFIGGKLKYYNLSNEPYYEMPDKRQWMPQRLVYHSSWDWLMPVVEKISSISHDKYKNYDMPMELFMCSIFDKKESVWKYVVEFITWYNTQNKPK